MFSRLFNLYAKKEISRRESSHNWKNNLEDFQAEPSLPALGEDKIRVVVFRECEKKADKTLLFDSDAIIVTEPGVAGDSSNSKMCRSQFGTSQKSSDNILGCSPPKYKRIKPSSDIKVLGEMIFGSVAMVYKGSVQKVHLIRTPPQLLMTKVFALRSRSAGVNFCDSEMTSSCTSTTPSLNISAGSLVSSRPGGKKHHTRSYSNPVIRSNLRRNSAKSSWSLNSSESLNQSYGGISITESPCGSLQNRYTRSKMTSLDSTEILRSKSEQSEENRMAYKQQPKIGVGIIFKLWEDDEENNRLFQDFFFSHYTLFESHLQTFRVKIEKSFYLRKNFTDVVIKAVDSFKHRIITLCYSPRIVEPVWLNLMILGEQKHNETVEKFMSSFMSLIKKCENKQNNYFLSILLTAVLTNHPSWVATVMPSSNSAKRSYLDKHTSNSLDVLAKCHPYNPLWAQLCDMYGSVNYPRKLARTIIVGENANLVVELLYLLTYFLRCSNVIENNLTNELPEENNSYRFSGSSWNETMFNETGTPNSVRSWIDKVSCVNTSELVTDVNELELPNSSKTKTLDEKVTSKCSDTIYPSDDGKTNFFDNVMQEQIDISHCYCGYLQKLDSSLGRKNLRNLIKNTDKENLVNLLGGSNCKEQNGNINNSKSCKGCRTLEKTIFEQYCDKCKEILNNLSLEIDSVCRYCILHLEKLREMIHTNDTPTSSSNINKRLLDDTGPCTNVRKSFDESQCISESNKLFKKENPCNSRSSFRCYCCPRGDLPIDNSDTCTQDHVESDEEFITRERKASDPVDCAPSPKLTTKVLLRHSTTSHDSGTEMACSVSSSCPELDSGESLNLTRDNSVSSHDNLFNSDTIVGDMDSDYCSVDNDQTSTVSEVTCFETEQLINTVCKSSSSTTIKEIYVNLDSPAMKTIESTTDCNSVLDTELDSMNLKEVPLPRIVQTPLPQTKCNADVTPDLTTFGSSLFAGYCDSYVSDFVLHGTGKLDEEKLATDLQNSIKYSVLDEQVYDAACVVADTDNWSCEVWNLSRRTDTIDRNTCESLTRKPVYASSLVSSMIESTKELWEMDMPAKFCLLHLEEQLKDIYHRSKVLGEYAFINTLEDTSSFIKSQCYRANDVELLKAVCVAHSPHCDEFLS